MQASKQRFLDSSLVYIIAGAYALHNALGRASSQGLSRAVTLHGALTDDPFTTCSDRMSLFHSCFALGTLVPRAMISR